MAPRKRAENENRRTEGRVIIGQRPIGRCRDAPDSRAVSHLNPRFRIGLPSVNGFLSYVRVPLSLPWSLAACWSQLPLGGCVTRHKSNMASVDMKAKPQSLLVPPVKSNKTRWSQVESKKTSIEFLGSDRYVKSGNSAYPVASWI